MDYDIVVVGAGPAGFSFVRGISASGLRVALVDHQTRASLANPIDDGREIALTHRSVDILCRLGAWEKFDPATVSPLRSARVFDGNSLLALSIEPGGGSAGLGQLVSNHRLRRALFAVVEQQAGLSILANSGVASVRTSPAGSR